jgi:hypothetical protein
VKPLVLGFSASSFSGFDGAVVIGEATFSMKF